MEYYWNSETVESFKEEISYLTKTEMIVEVTRFVISDCQLEKGDTNQTLIDSLLSKIYS